MELNYKSFGKGEPVIILHGLFGMLDNWQTVAKKLATQNKVFILDLRNHGKSPHSDEFDYSIMADDVRDFMEQKGIGEAEIIGHSMGGKVAMHMALAYASRVRKLMIVDIAPKFYKGDHQSIFDALLTLDLSSIQSRKEANAFLSKRIPRLSTRQFLLKNIYLDSTTRKYKWKMNLPVLHAKYRSILEHNFPEEPYLGETLFVKGEKSDYLNFAELESYRQFFPNARLLEIAHAGHWVHAEQTLAFVELAQTFLS